MSNDTPNGTLAKLRYAITNLWNDYGQADSIPVALIINILLTAVGVGIVVWFDGLIELAGASWATLHVLAILKWAVGL
jgi:hypothetical protein